MNDDRRPPTGPLMDGTWQYMGETHNEPEHATLSDGTVLRERTWAELRDGGYPVTGNA